MGKESVMTCSVEDHSGYDWVPSVGRKIPDKFGGYLTKIYECYLVCQLVIGLGPDGILCGSRKVDDSTEMYAGQVV